jgi:hypothetical protein
VSLSETVRTLAGRWTPAPGPRLPVVADEPPYSTPRAACVLMRGEQVLIDGRWRAVDRAECVRSSQGPAQTLLFLADGGILGSRFDYVYVSRDAAEQVLALGVAVAGGAR